MSTRISNPERNQVPSIEETRQIVVGRLRSLMKTMSRKFRIDEEFENLQALIESLPLASGEFGVASNRLRNAQRYLRSDEIGASLYELRLLLGCL
jgi:hypothetical protein